MANNPKTPAKFNIGDLVTLRESFYKYYGRDLNVSECKYGIILNHHWALNTTIYEVYWMPHSVTLKEVEHRLELLSRR